MVSVGMHIALGLRRGLALSGPAGESGPPAPPWWQPIDEVIGPLSMFVVAGEGIAEDVGFGVSVWDDVRGGPALSQPGVTSLRPTNLGASVHWDGVDDRQRMANPALLNGEHTIIVGFDNPINDTAVRTLLCASNASSSGSLRQVHVNYGGWGDPNATRQRYYDADASAASTVQMMDLSPIGAGPYNLALRCGPAPAGAMVADRLGSPLVDIGADTTGPATDEAKTQAEVGCRVLGAGPTRSQFWGGDIRYLIVAAASLSDGQLAIIYNTLNARGLL